MDVMTDNSARGAALVPLILSALRQADAAGVAGEYLALGYFDARSLTDHVLAAMGRFQDWKARDGQRMLSFTVDHGDSRPDENIPIRIVCLHHHVSAVGRSKV